MCGENQTSVTHVTLMGFGNLLQMKHVFSGFFLIMYLATLTGNTLIICLIIVSPKLHSPMYIFLGNLSLCEILFTSLVLPQNLYVIWGNGGSVSLTYCLIQFYLYTSGGAAEILFLTIMAYDRFLAICSPLRYPSLMNQRTQNNLVLTAWILASLAPATEAISMCNLQFCHSNIIDHYICDAEPIIQMSSSNTNLAKMVVFNTAVVFGLFPFALIIASYVSIFISISRISTMRGRQKTFSTCTSHLSSVCMYFGTVLVIYLVPSELYGKKLNKIITLGYTVVTPMANPFIYSLRNHEMKACLSTIIFCLKT